MATTTRTVTYEEWLTMPGVRDSMEEVVNGEIRVVPPPKLKRTLIVRQLGKLLDSQVDERDVLVLVAPFGIVIRKHPLNSRVPDIAMFAKKTMVVQDGYIHSAPELIAEVFSPANTAAERAETLHDYESLGVPEVWVLSPDARTVEILQLHDGKLRAIQIVTTGPLSAKLFPHVTIEVSSIWPE